MPRIAEAAVERARLTVVPRTRTRAARMPFVVLVSLILLGGVVGLLLFNTSMQQASFAATALEEQSSTLTAREQTLKMELDVLRDPQNVAEQAQRMGMVVATNPSFLRLSDGKVLGQALPASAAGDLRLQPRRPVKPAVLQPAPVVVPAEVGSDVATGSADDSSGDTASASAETRGAGGTDGTDGDRSSDDSQR
jgi:hypothetical protein